MSLDKKKAKKLKNTFGKKKSTRSILKKVLKNHSRPYFYHKILMSVPKLFNISQKDDFTQQKKTTLFNRNIKY